MSHIIRYASSCVPCTIFSKDIVDICVCPASSPDGTPTLQDTTAFKITSYNNNNMYLLTTIELSPGGSGYFTCKQNMKLVTTKFKLGGLHEKHVVATWNVGNHLSICL